jgi:hypothetical protein
MKNLIQELQDQLAPTTTRASVPFGPARDVFGTLPALIKKPEPKPEAPAVNEALGAVDEAGWYRNGETSFRDCNTMTGEVHVSEDGAKTTFIPRGTAKYTPTTFANETDPGDLSTAQPFGSREERDAAFNDPRYKTSADFRKEVLRRSIVTG